MTPAEEKRAKMETELNNLDPIERGQVWEILAQNQRDIGRAVRDGCSKVPERMSVADARSLLGTT
jgi:hypothetical protein